MTNTRPARLLEGLTIVVTRPRAQGIVTAQRLEAASADTLLYPVLDIAPLPIAEIEKKFSINTLQNVSALIFVSANAVEHGMPIIKHWRGLSEKAYRTAASNATLYAIGNMTADALRMAIGTDRLQKIETPSSGSDSEALLSMPALQDVAGQHIIIVCGHSEAGGRTILQQTLRERGAVVTLLTCYTRKSAAVSDAQQEHLQALLQSMLQPKKAIAFLALSVETLDSLMQNLGKIMTEATWPQYALRCTLLVSHPRVAQAARLRGWQHIEVVPMANEALIEALHLLKPSLISHN